jgi:hypothetical protein
MEALKMNKDIQEMCLVTGEVKYTVYVSLLVPKEDAQNEEHMKELFEDRAYDSIESSDCEAEYIDEVPVLLSKKTADKLNYNSIGQDTWTEIIQESTAIRDNQ